MKFYTNVMKRKNRILLRGYEDGKRFSSQIKYKPWIFLPAKNDSDTKYRTIDGQKVDKKIFDSPNEMTQFIQKYEDIDGFDYYGLEYPQYTYLYEHYRNCEFDTKLLKINIIDIEVDTEDGFPDLETASNKITAITMQYPNQDITFALGYGDFTPEDDKVKYIKCKDEEDLLTKFITIWSSETFGPDVVSGWNIEFFDIPYIVGRVNRILGEEDAKKLSPWGILENKTVKSFGRMQKVYFPAGIAVLDYMALYKKFVAPFEPQESYRLDHIAFVELEQRKLDYSEYGSLHELYKNDHQMFMTYNVLDCELIKRINDKRKLFELVFFIAYGAGVNYADALGTVRSWDVAIHNYLLDRKFVVSKFRYNEGRHPAGGFVKFPQTGMHEWVVSFDLTSLYPHLIMGYNIGPDTLRGKLKQNFTSEELMTGAAKPFHDYLDENNLCLAANSCLFDRSNISFLSALMKEMFNQRTEYKKIMLELKKEKETSKKSVELENKISHYDTLQHSLKIRLNSAYGALASPYFRWYQIDLAEAITLSGQLTIKYAEKKFNEHLNKIFKTEDHDYIITVDTDSVYVKMNVIAETLVKQGKSKEEILNIIDIFCEKNIQPYLDKIFEDLAIEMRSKEQAMYMKREGISDRGVFIAKKRYILNVLNNEGIQYKKPKLKIMGLESVRSSTPSCCRKSIEEAVRIILQEDEVTLQKYIAAFREKHRSLPFSEIGLNSSVNELNNYHRSDTIYGPKCPIYVRGALLYNNFRKQKKLTKKIEEIFEGSKVKYAYLKMPNPIRENVIAAPSGILPKEFGLEEYIDYDTLFEKSFLNPITKILDLISWSDTEKIDLEGFWE